MQEINASIGFDRRLWRQDIEGLARPCGNAGEDRAAQRARTRRDRNRPGRDRARRSRPGGSPFDTALEDIHMNIEARLAERIGDAGRRLHTARSRNDQVATDFRLWVRDAIDGLTAQIADVMRALAERAAAHAADPMPGFTHLQTAQPVTFGHHLLAYVEMLDRDRGRLADAARRLNECPLGAAALAGTSFPIDRDMTAPALGFDRPAANSLDAVSDRDFALEFLAAAAISAMHLSRFAEEIVIWCSAPYRLRPAVRCVHHRQLDHAAEAQPRRGRTGAREDRPGHRRAGGAADGDEGPAAGLCQGHAGGQGAGVRRRRRLGAVRSPRWPAWCATCSPTRRGCSAIAGAGFATATDLADWLVRVLRPAVPQRAPRDRPAGGARRRRRASISPG